MFLQNRNRLTDVENKLVIIRGQKKWVGGQLRGLGLSDANQGLIHKATAWL